MRISDWSADVCSSDLPGAAQAPLPKDSADLALARLDHFRIANGGSPTAEIRTEMQRAMSAHAAVFRTDELMAEVKEKLTKRSEEHTSELQSLMRISYAVFCLKKKNTHTATNPHTISRPQLTTQTHINHVIHCH